MANNLALGIIIGASVSSSLGRAFQSLETRASSLGRSLGQVRLGRAAADDVIRYRTQLDNLNTAQRQFGLGNTRLWGQIAQTERHLRAATTVAQRYGLNVGNITRENRLLIESEARLGRQLARTHTLQANRDRRGQLQGQIIGTVGMAYALSAPIKKAIEFESKMADIRKVADMTAPELKLLGKAILDSSATMPMSAVGIGSIVEAGLQAGIVKNEILAFKDSAVKMGVAFDISGEDAGQTMVSWRSGMALTQKQVESLADAINYIYLALCDLQWVTLLKLFTFLYSSFDKLRTNGER